MGNVTTVAGSGQGAALNCFDDGDGGPATAARLNHPLGVTVADSGDLYIAVGFAGSNLSAVRKVSHGIISTVAGGVNCCALGDGGPATSAVLRLGPYLVSGLVVDESGDLYIADAGNCRVRRVSHGIITTIAGNGTCPAAGDGGPAVDATLHPVDVAFDSDGTLYVAGNNRVRTVFGVALDSDQDGYTDLQETAVSEDNQNYCPIMRADVDSDGTVSILDLSKVAGSFMQPVPPAPRRYRQGPPPFMGGISILDLSKMAAKFGQPVSACP